MQTSWARQLGVHVCQICFGAEYADDPDDTEVAVGKTKSGLLVLNDDAIFCRETKF
jgi:hypothetical protein